METLQLMADKDKIKNLIPQIIQTIIPKSHLLKMSKTAFQLQIISKLFQN
jgi:hypothetical protein